MKITAKKCPSIILLSGTPGTGKSSISISLSMQNGWKIFSLGDFIVERKLFSSEIDIHDTKIIDTETAAREAAQEIFSYFMNFQIIVVDSHYADIIMEGFNEIMSEINNECINEYIQGLNIIGIVCRCHPEVLQKRLKDRNYSVSKIMENVQAEILSESTQNLLEVLPKERILEVDTSKYSALFVAEKVYNYINHPNEKFSDNILSNVGDIDWIHILNQKGTLDSYFKEDYGEKTPINYKDVVDTEE